LSSSSSSSDSSLSDQGRIPSTGRWHNVAKRACGEGAGGCSLLACGSRQRVHVAYPPARLHAVRSRNIGEPSLFASSRV
jgi:hypothetical protein